MTVVGDVTIVVDENGYDDTGVTGDGGRGVKPSAIRRHCSRCAALTSKG